MNKIDELKLQIKLCYSMIYDLEDKIRTIQDTCKHNITTKGYACSAYCTECQKYFGWYCADAPNKYCVYDGDEEHCIFCGAPEERK